MKQAEGQGRSYPAKVFHDARRRRHRWQRNRLKGTHPHRAWDPERTAGTSSAHPARVCGGFRSRLRQAKVGPHDADKEASLDVQLEVVPETLYSEKDCYQREVMNEVSRSELCMLRNQRGCYFSVTNIRARTY